MSFFVGHSLAALTVYSFKPPFANSRFRSYGWLLWLVIVASAPDVDYVVGWLAAPANHNARITHSLAFGLILPFCTAVVLACLKLPQNVFRVLCAQVFAAGLSHLLLDFLVGATGDPLFYPFSTTTYKAAIGILPSAGALRLTNRYFYRNLLIETGILVPFLLLLLEIRRNRANKNRFKLIALATVMIGFLIWSISLKR